MTYDPAIAAQTRRQEFLNKAKAVTTKEAACDLAYARHGEIYCEAGHTQWLDEAPAWVRATHAAIMRKAESTISSISLATTAGNAAYDAFQAQ